MSDKTIVNKINSHHFVIPTYTVVEDKGIQLSSEVYKDDMSNMGKISISFVRGSKIQDENKLPKQDGILVEQLLEMCKQQLESVNVGEFRNRDTSLAITHIENAILRLLKRELDRKKNKTLGTYQNK